MSKAGECGWSVIAPDVRMANLLKLNLTREEICCPANIEDIFIVVLTAFMWGNIV